MWRREEAAGGVRRTQRETPVPGQVLLAHAGLQRTAVGEQRTRHLPWQFTRLVAVLLGHDQD
jgi:hypothetical protein